jgi:hypothetical protein
MKTLHRPALNVFVILLLTLTTSAMAVPQESVTLIAKAELSQVVPSGFYFQGKSGGTQMRNAAAVRFGSNRYVIAALVDTSGYASEVREKYQGFLITDSSVRIGGFELPTGAYGFGFSNDGKFTVLDLSGKEVFTQQAAQDKDLKRPAPLMMSKSGAGVRLYAGRSYVAIAAN